MTKSLDPMKVAYLTSLYPATSHTFIKREVAALRRQGVRVDTFSVRLPSESERTGENREEAESTFTILSQSLLTFFRAHLRTIARRPINYLKTAALAVSHRPPGARSLLLSFAHFAEAVTLADELDRRSIRHLHTHFANSGATVGLLAATLLGIRWSFVVHGPSETDYPAGYLLPDKVRAADMVVCVSWFGHSQAMRLVSADHWRKFRLVHCGLDLRRMTKVEQGARDANTLICVGRLCADKAQAGLLEAFALIRQEVPKARLRLVGDGPDRDALEKMARDLQIADRVDFLGRLPEAETLAEIARAGMMVLPSFWEGLPVVLMEAMAMGVPVITSRIAGTPEMIIDGRNGLLFTPAKWPELGKCIRRLLDRPELGAQLATAARATIEQDFDVDVSARRLQRFFGEWQSSPAPEVASIGVRTDREARVGRPAAAGVER